MASRDSDEKMLITGVVSIVIRFGLAITAWGGWVAFFRHPAFRALAAVTVVLAALAVPSGGGLSSGQKENRGNRWVLGAFGVIGVLMAFFSSYTDRTGSCRIAGQTTRSLEGRSKRSVQHAHQRPMETLL